MKFLHRLAPVAMALLLGAWPAAGERLQARAGEGAWHGWSEAGRACVAARDAGTESCWALGPAGRLSDLAVTAGGWAAAGWEHDGEDTDIFVVLGGDGGLERLPQVPRREAPRGRPRLISDGVRLLGVVWLEGGSQPSLEVRAAPWLGGAWGPVATVSPAGVGSQVAPDAAVLDDGRWLVVWTAFDGVDDETRWSVFDDERWSPPGAVHEDNDVPDITPAVLATRAGAILAWTWFDGRDYRVRTAFFDGDTWRLGPALAGRGAGDPALVEAAGAYLLRFQTVVPEEWVGVELDAQGAARRRAAVPSGRMDAPLVGIAGSGVAFRWPGDDETVAPWEERP